jgi:cell wall-associated NlpC family hydrolase
MEILLKAGRYGSGAVPDVDALVAAASGGVAEEPTAAGISSTARAVVMAASQVLGTPYVWGAESPTDGFDCSGLVWWSYRQAGVDVARTTDDLVRMGAPVAEGMPLRPGDLIFTRGGQQVHDLGHVAIYVGGGVEIVAPRSGKSVTVQKVDMDRVQAVRRILTA